MMGVKKKTKKKKKFTEEKETEIGSTRTRQRNVSTSLLYKSGKVSIKLESIQLEVRFWGKKGKFGLFLDSRARPKA